MAPPSPTQSRRATNPHRDRRRDRAAMLPNTGITPILVHHDEPTQSFPPWTAEACKLSERLASLGGGSTCRSGRGICGAAMALSDRLSNGAMTVHDDKRLEALLRPAQSTVGEE